MKLVPDSNGNRVGECKEDRQRKEESKRNVKYSNLHDSTPMLSNSGLAARAQKPILKRCRVSRNRKIALFKGSATLWRRWTCVPELTQKILLGYESFLKYKRGSNLSS